METPGNQRISKEGHTVGVLLGWSIAAFVALGPVVSAFLLLLFSLIDHNISVVQFLKAWLGLTLVIYTLFLGFKGGISLLFATIAAAVLYVVLMRVLLRYFSYLADSSFRIAVTSAVCGAVASGLAWHFILSVMGMPLDAQVEWSLREVVPAGTLVGLFLAWRAGRVAVNTALNKDAAKTGHRTC